MPLQVASVGICMQLLSLSAANPGKAEGTVAVQQAMVKAAQASAANGKSSHAPVAPGLEGGNASVGTQHVLQVGPVGGRYSRFFGQSEVRAILSHAHGCTANSAQLKYQ